MARPTNLENMTYTQLRELIAEAERMMVAKQHQAREDLKEKMAAEARDAGMSLDELFGKDQRKGGRGGSRQKVAAKYRDPKNPANTWSGRGLMPRWMAAAVKEGKKKDSFLIK